jgi:hypothetical protein
MLFEFANAKRFPVFARRDTDDSLEDSLQVIWAQADSPRQRLKSKRLVPVLFDVTARAANGFESWRRRCLILRLAAKTGAKASPLGGLG